MISTLPEFTETSGDDGPPAVQVEVTAEKKANQELAEQIEPNANELEEVRTWALGIPIWDQLTIY